MFPPFSSMNSSCPPLLSPPTMSDSADRAVLPPEGALRAYPSQEMAALQHLESPKPNIKTNNDVRKTCQSSFNAHAKNIQKHHRAATLQSVSISNPTHTDPETKNTLQDFQRVPPKMFLYTLTSAAFLQAIIKEHTKSAPDQSKPTHQTWAARWEQCDGRQHDGWINMSFWFWWVQLTIVGQQNLVN